MSNNLGIDFADDLEQAIDDLPSTLTVNSVEYQVVADEERRSIELEDAGTYAIYDRNVYAILSEFATVPAVRSTVTLGSVKYYVVDVQRQPETDTLNLTLRREDGS